MSVELIYLDSVVFLAYFQEERGRVELCRGTLERAGVGDVCIITSALNHCRMPLAPERAAGPERSSRYRAEIFPPLISARAQRDAPNI